MNRWFLAFLLGCVVLTAGAQQKVKVIRQQSLKQYGIVPGNYSGITRIDGNMYAVCDDKTADGFFLWNIDIDSITGQIRSVHDEGFRASGAANRDAEDIAYVAENQTLYMVSEADNRIYSYQLDGKLKESASPTLLDHPARGTGLEALTYDAGRRCLWAMEENNGSGQCSLFALNLQLAPLQTQTYTLDPPQAQQDGRIHVQGVSAVCALDDGRLLVLEREAFVPKRKIGAWVQCLLYAIRPETPQQKQLMASWRTRIHLTTRSWANYEGMCLGPRLRDGRQVLLLLSDSQKGYGAVLKDRIRSIVLP